MKRSVTRLRQKERVDWTRLGPNQGMLGMNRKRHMIRYPRRRISRNHLKLDDI